MKKNCYNIECNEDQLNIIINALETADNYYNDYMYDAYDDFDELEKIIETLKGLKNDL